MTREEMLARLHGIAFGARPSAMTSDLGLEYVYASAEGAGMGLGGMGDWPVHLLTGLTPEKAAALKGRILTDELTRPELDGTPLAAFNDYVFSIERDETSDFTAFFADLLNLPEQFGPELYALCDAREWVPTVNFYTEEAAVETAFIDRYVDAIQPWEDFSDGELEAWMRRVDAGLQGLAPQRYTAGGKQA